MCRRGRAESETGRGNGQADRWRRDGERIPRQAGACHSIASNPMATKRHKKHKKEVQLGFSFFCAFLCLFVAILRLVFCRHEFVATPSQKLQCRPAQQPFARFRSTSPVIDSISRPGSVSPSGNG